MSRVGIPSWASFNDLYYTWLSCLRRHHEVRPYSSFTTVPFKLFHLSLLAVTREFPWCLSFYIGERQRRCWSCK